MGIIDVGKIAVLGSGSVGLYHGGKLAAGGANVSFLMRSASTKPASARSRSIASKVQMSLCHIRRYSVRFVKLAGVTLWLWH